MGCSSAGGRARSRSRAARSARRPDPPRSGTRQRSPRCVILVVDDEPAIRELLRRILENDYDVLDEPDGPAALKLLRSRQVDLILLDLLLPGMSGVDVLSRLRVTHPKTPVILVTGAATVPTAVTAMKLGALDCLVKPFANKELLARVRDALARQPGSRSIQKPVTQLLIVGTDLGVVGTLQITISTRFSVDSAWTLPEALERLKSPSYVAIVLDDSVAPVDSLVFLRAVRARLPSCSVIVLAARPERWTTTEFAPLAISAVVPKPYHLNDLMDHLATAFTMDRQHHTATRFNSVIGRAIDYFRDHFAGTSTLTAVASSIGVSRGHLANLCRTDLGMTPRQFVARVRIEITKHLLRDTDMKIEAIADLIGFHDASHLSRVFKRYVRSRPGRYRH